MAKKSLTIQNNNGDLLYPVTVSSLVYNRFTEESVEEELNNKLESSDIKTVNGVSLIGSGNVTIEGKSAYEVAVDNGFVGTRQLWLDSLRGPQGNTGNVTVTDGVALITIVNNLTDGGTGDALSAEMGKELSQDVEAMKYVLEMDGSELNLINVSLGYCTGSTSEHGTYSGGGSKLEGDTVTVTATPSEGYTFAGWYSDASGTTLVSSNASYTFVASESIELYAKFEEEFEQPTVLAVNEIMNDGNRYGFVSITDGVGSLRTTSNPDWNAWVILMPIGYGAIIDATQSGYDTSTYPTSNASVLVEFRYGICTSDPVVTLLGGTNPSVTSLYASRHMLRQSHWVAASSEEVRWLVVSCSQALYGTPTITLVKVLELANPINFAGKLGGTSGKGVYISTDLTIKSSSSLYGVSYVLLEANKIGYITLAHRLGQGTASSPMKKDLRVATSANLPAIGGSLEEILYYTKVFNPITSDQTGIPVHFVIPAASTDRYVCLLADTVSSGNEHYASNLKFTKITPDTSVLTRSTPVLLKSAGLKSVGLRSTNTSSSNAVRSIRLDRIEASISDLSNAVDNIESSEWNTSGIAELESTVNNIDNRVSNNTLKISNIEAAIEELGGDVSGSSMISRDPYGLNLHCSATEGQMRFIKRARQLTDIKFTPAFNMRRVCGNWDGANLDDVFTAGKEYQGIPYTRIYNMYGLPYLAVGNCVSLDTFATACAKVGSWLNVFNPAAASSYIYSNVENNGTNVVGSDMKACFYGTYCSGFWAYAYDVKYCYLTYVKDTAGFTQGDVIGTLNASNLHNSLLLGDTLINYPNNVNRTSSVSHVVIVTDVWYNNDGTIYAVEVSESTTSGRYDYTQKGLPYGGVCRRMMWPVDKFLENWEQYTIYHYNDFEHIDYTPSSVIPVGNEGRWFADKRFLPLLPKSGNHFLYKKSFLTEKNLTNVVLMPTISGTVNVVNELADTNVNYTCTAGTNLGVVGNEIGTYSACIKGSSSTSLKCYWRVSDATITANASGNTVMFNILCPDDIDIPWNVSFSTSSSDSLALVRNGKVRCTNGSRIQDTIPFVNGNTRTYSFSVSRPSSNYTCAWVTFKTKEFGNWVSDAVTIGTATITQRDLTILGKYDIKVLATLNNDTVETNYNYNEANGVTATFATGTNIELTGTESAYKETLLGWKLNGNDATSPIQISSDSVLAPKVKGNLAYVKYKGGTWSSSMQVTSDSNHYRTEIFPVVHGEQLIIKIPNHASETVSVRTWYCSCNKTYDSTNSGLLSIALDENGEGAINPKITGHMALHIAYASDYTATVFSESDIKGILIFYKNTESWGVPAFKWNQVLDLGAVSTTSGSNSWNLSMLIYGNYMLTLSATLYRIKVIDLTTMSVVNTITNNSPLLDVHANSSCFLPKKYDESDYYPMFITNVHNATPDKLVIFRLAGSSATDFTLQRICEWTMTNCSYIDLAVKDNTLYIMAKASDANSLYRGIWSLPVNWNDSSIYVDNTFDLYSSNNATKLSDYYNSVCQDVTLVAQDNEDDLIVESYGPTSGMPNQHAGITFHRANSSSSKLVGWLPTNRILYGYEHDGIAYAGNGVMYCVLVNSSHAYLYKFMMTFPTWAD